MKDKIIAIKSLLKTKEYTHALSLCTEAYNEYNNNIFIFLKAFAYYKIKNYKNSIKYYKQLLEKIKIENKEINQDNIQNKNIKEYLRGIELLIEEVSKEELNELFNIFTDILDESKEKYNYNIDIKIIFNKIFNTLLSFYPPNIQCILLLKNKINRNKFIESFIEKELENYNKEINKEYEKCIKENITPSSIESKSQNLALINIKYNYLYKILEEYEDRRFLYLLISRIYILYNCSANCPCLNTDIIDNNKVYVNDNTNNTSIKHIRFIKNIQDNINKIKNNIKEKNNSIIKIYEIDFISMNFNKNIIKDKSILKEQELLSRYLILHRKIPEENREHITEIFLSKEYKREEIKEFINIVEEIYNYYNKNNIDNIKEILSTLYFIDKKYNKSLKLFLNRKIKDYELQILLILLNNYNLIDIIKNIIELRINNKDIIINYNNIEYNNNIYNMIEKNKKLLKSINIYNTLEYIFYHKTDNRLYCSYFNPKDKDNIECKDNNNINIIIIKIIEEDVYPYDIILNYNIKYSINKIIEEDINFIDEIYIMTLIKYNNNIYIDNNNIKDNKYYNLDHNNSNIDNYINRMLSSIENKNISLLSLSEFYRSIGFLYFYSRKYSLSLKYMNISIRYNRNKTAMIFIVEIYERMGMYEKIIECNDYNIEIIKVKKIIAYNRLKKYKEAAELIENIKVSNKILDDIIALEKLKCFYKEKESYNVKDNKNIEDNANIRTNKYNILIEENKKKILLYNEIKNIIHKDIRKYEDLLEKKEKREIEEIEDIKIEIVEKDNLKIEIYLNNININVNIEMYIYILYFYYNNKIDNNIINNLIARELLRENIKVWKVKAVIKKDRQSLLMMMDNRENSFIILHLLDYYIKYNLL